MLEIFCDLVAKLGSFISQTANVGCFVLVMFDEPECPECLID